MNIICYRVRGHDDEQTARLRTASLADGRFYILKTRARGALWLRSAIMNPLTEPRDLDELIAHLRTLARA
jgi:hypothetical protein